ncbi:MAG: T9SS type A sorting domain-containing protein [Bacteroidota bacterium]
MSAPAPRRVCALVVLFALGSIPFLSATAQTEPDPLPDPWLHEDIGTLRVRGGAGVVDGRFGVGGGGDIWGDRDAFHFAYQPLVGDGVVEATYEGQTSGEPWAKAGLMVRVTLQPESPHVFYAVTPGNGSHLQSRTQRALDTEGVDATDSQPLACCAGDQVQRYRLIRTGNTITAQWREGNTWATAAVGSIVTTDTVYVGLAVTATNIDDAPRRNIAWFRDPVVRTYTPMSVPAPWLTDDVGTVVPGRATYEPNTETFALTGGGDVWGEADAFRYVWQPALGDVSILARIPAIDGPQAWTKAGLMIRDGLDPSAAHVFALTTRDAGPHLQTRIAAGASMDSAPLDTTAADTTATWLRLDRVGDLFTASTSPDGAEWTVRDSVEVAMAEDVLVGIAVTATDFMDDGLFETGAARFDQVQVIGGEEPALANDQVLIDRLSVEVFPNPFVQTATLSLTLPRAGTYEVIMHDLLGRTVRTWSVPSSEVAAVQLQADLSGRPAGVYVVRARHQESGLVATDRVTLLR